jgi:hypothetical protein
MEDAADILHRMFYSKRCCYACGQAAGYPNGKPKFSDSSNN